MNRRTDRHAQRRPQARLGDVGHDLHPVVDGVESADHFEVLRDAGEVLFFVIVVGVVGVSGVLLASASCVWARLLFSWVWAIAACWLRCCVGGGAWLVGWLVGACNTSLLDSALQSQKYATHHIQTLIYKQYSTYTTYLGKRLLGVVRVCGVVTRVVAHPQLLVGPGVAHPEVGGGCGGCHGCACRFMWLCIW